MRAATRVPKCLSDMSTSAGSNATIVALDRSLEARGKPDRVGR